MPAIGALLAGKYRVLSQLGEGGMGAVFRAENQLTGKQVALKWMHPHLAQNPDASHRFLREARAASSLMHPNVVDVYDVVQEDTTLCLVMELLEGETLREYLGREAQPGVQEYLSLLLPAMAGVSAAHERGIVHRDLKPDNIFLARVPGAPGPVPKVVDFGIAKFSSNDLSNLTQTGAAIGTPMYMSLEQLRGDRDVDARADVYAFGVMLYQGFTGRTPFGATTLAELAIRIATTEPLAVSTLRPDLPEALSQAIDRAVARDRAQRWPSMEALIRALEPFQSSPATGSARSNSGRLAARASWPRLDSRSTNGDNGSRRATPSSDTLTARELPPQQSGLQRVLPIWIAAVGLFLIASIGAVLLLRTESESAGKEPGVQTETQTDHRASTSSPPVTLPHVTPPPTRSAHPANLATEDIVPNTEPLRPADPPARVPELAKPYVPPELPKHPEPTNATNATNIGRIRKPRLRPPEPAQMQAPERPQLAKPVEKSAVDVLGFLFNGVQILVWVVRMPVPVRPLRTAESISPALQSGAQPPC